MVKVCLLRPADGVSISSAATLTPSPPLGPAYIAAAQERAARLTSRRGMVEEETAESSNGKSSNGKKRNGKP